MKASYIQFEAPKNGKNTSKEGLLKRMFFKALVAMMSEIIPKANPDFDGKIGDVIHWLVECDNETGIPEREIGLDEEGNVILKMPFKDNYGYWTDNNLLLNDFKTHFMTSEISKEIFEEKWELIL